MGNYITVKEAKSWLEKLQEDSIRTALPAAVKPEYFCRIALTTLRKNPALMKCEQGSIAAALVQSAQLGLVCDGFLGHAYLVPFKGECTLILGYKGLIELVRRSGEVAKISMESVYSGDEFSYTKGLDPTLHHVPGDKHGISDSDITHVYVAVKLKDGTNVFDVWPRKKVEAHRDRYSKGASRPDSPWRTEFGLMGQKSVLRQMVSKGLLPVSVEVQRLAATEDVLDAQTVNGSVVSSRSGKPSLEDLSAKEEDVQDAELVLPDQGEILAEAISDIEAAATLKAAKEAYDKWSGSFSGESMDQLDQALIEQEEIIRSKRS